MIAIFPLILIKLAIMNRPAFYSLSALLAACLLGPAQLSARPVDYGEVSLLVRCRESESSIRDEVTRRKLMHPLTAQQEATLKTQGASDSLVQSLRNSNLYASKEEIEELDARDRRLAAARRETAEAPQPAVHVFNVAFGHPINLSEYGGADYEIAIYSYRVAGEDHVQAAMIDNVRTGTDVSRTIPLISEGEAFSSGFFPTNGVRNWRYTPYDAQGDVRDNRFNFSDSVAISSHAFGRPLHIDWENPVFMTGQSYTFYHVYGAGGASLYYIGRANQQSAIVAVVSRPGW
jgi:hypothetical protein